MILIETGGRGMGRQADVRTGKRRAIRDALGRLGMHANPAAVVRELAGTIAVSEDLVRAVRIDLLKRTDERRRHQAEFSKGSRTSAPHRPQKKPRRG